MRDVCPYNKKKQNHWTPRNLKKKLFSHFNKYKGDKEGGCVGRF